MSQKVALKLGCSSAPSKGLTFVYRLHGKATFVSQRSLFLGDSVTPKAIWAVLRSPAKS